MAVATVAGAAGWGAAPAPAAHAAGADPVTPTFRQRTTTTVTAGGTVSSSGSILAGDLDEDGLTDLIAYGTSSTARVSLATGPGTWGPATTVPIGSSPPTVLLTDVDLDGHLDLFTTQGSLGIAVLRGDGHGGFGTALLGSGTATIGALGDVDGDGKLDAVTSNGATVQVRKGAGDGTFAAPVDGPTLTGVKVRSLATGDLDGDGRDDVVATSADSNPMPASAMNYVRVLHAGVGGALTTTFTMDLGASSSRASVDDVDGDTHLDAVVTNTLGRIWTLWGVGDGTVTASEPTSGNTLGASSAVLADLDDDGDPDLAYTDIDNARVMIRRNLGNRTFEPDSSYVVDVYPTSLVLADLSGDGRPDLGLVAGTGRVVSYLAALGGGGFAGAAGRSNSAVNVDRPRLGDVDGDGDPDIVVNGYVYLTGPAGRPIQAPGGILGAGSTAEVALTQLGGDDDLDVVFTSSGGVSQAHGNGDGDGTFAPAVVATTPAAPSDLAVGDLDEDGHDDVVASLPSTGQVAVLRSDGAGALEAPVTVTAGPAPGSLVVADLDGDGHLDVVVANETNLADSLTVLLGDGDGGFGPPTTVALDTTPFVVAAGDLDGDGVVDLVVAGEPGTTTEVRYLLGDGDGGFAAHGGQTVDAPVKRLELADLNGDGTLDVVVATARFLLNRGDATFAGVLGTVPSGEYAGSPAVGDLDGDGRLDLVAASSGRPLVRFGAGPALPPLWAPFDSWGALVDRIYLDLLQRAPTTSERSADIAALTAHTLTPGGLVARIRTSTDHTTNVDPVVRLYRAYFLRNADPSGLDHWVAVRRKGSTLSRISNSFAASSEFTRRYGTLTNRQFVELIYQNVLGRPGEATGVAYWTKQLDTKRKSRGQVMLNFSESNEYKTKQTSEVTAGVLQTWMLRTIPTGTTFTDAVTALDTGTTTAQLATQIIDSGPYATRIANL
jgi:hypothetical protein